MTFWNDICELRRQNLIPQQWRRKHLMPDLKDNTKTVRSGLSDLTPQGLSNSLMSRPHYPRRIRSTEVSRSHIPQKREPS